MSQDAPRVRMDGIDWAQAFPGVRLFSAFRMALSPMKMLPAILLVVLMYLVGQGMDLLWGEPVASGEFFRYLTMDGETFDKWKDLQPDESSTHSGVFSTMLTAELAAFRGFVISAISLDFGVSVVAESDAGIPGGVLGSLWIMVIGVPGWLLTTYPIFAAVFAAIGFVLFCGLGGLIVRMAAVQACSGEPGKLTASVGFVVRKYVWLVLSPIIPLGIIAVLGLVLFLAGLAFFNVPVLDIVGSLLLGPMLLVGLAIAVMFIGLLLGGNLLHSAIAVEGTDAFDVISRVYNYVLGRPWRFVLYAGVVTVYGAVTYLIVGLVVFLALWATKLFLGMGVFTEIQSVNRLDAILPDPQLGEAFRRPDWDALDGSVPGKVSAGIASAWVQLLLAVVPAYALSYYLCSMTWVYLLLRKATDGTEYEDYERDLPERQPTPSKVEATGK